MRLLVTLIWLFTPAVLVAAEPFPPIYDSQKGDAKPQSPRAAAQGFRVPDGFHVSVFAAEPAVQNPIAMAWDTRGRLWIAENYTYAERGLKFDLNLRDRVVIFHDRDGDGQPDERKVFLDQIQRLTSVEVGLGGVWLMCPPQLLFVPDRNQDDIPDGPPQVVLEGFDVPTENYHNFANGLRWGPDGWLYGRCGASSPGNVYRPDQSPDAAIPLAGGVWRYHPKTKQFEPLCHGTTNPWGHDWDAFGECFFINTVNGHLWHSIPGAHFIRPHTISPNRLVYEAMEMIADHWHFDTGKGWVASRDIVKSGSDALGGGHAHIGATIYLGEQWPAHWRGKLLTLNMHGRRANVERLERAGCGYIGKHEPDTLFASDPFFRGMDLSYGPDGSVFVIDWSDTGECHENDGVHRNSGRIYRITYGKPTPQPTPRLHEATNAQLLKAVESPNEWLVRYSRRVLAEREAAGTLPRTVAEQLEQIIADTSRQPVERLRAAMAAYTIGVPAERLVPDLRGDKNEHLRAWALRFLTDHWTLDTAAGIPRAARTPATHAEVEYLATLARAETSGLVRQVLASTLQRLPVAERPTLAAALLAREEDATDPTQPFLVWYGLIPLAQQDPAQMVSLAAIGKFPQVREWAARYCAEIQAKQPAPLAALLQATTSAGEAERRQVIRGMAAGLAGVRKAQPPATWKAYPKAFTGADATELAAIVRNLDVVFGDGRALDEVRKLALDGKADLEVRKAALQTLIAAKPDDLRAVCENLLRVRFLNVVALTGLTRFADPQVGQLIARHYRTFHPTERAAVVAALASRPEFAAELLEQIAKGAIPASELTAFQARQIRDFDQPALTQRLRELWGELRDSPKEKADLIAKLTAELTPARIQSAHPAQGRVVFAKTCASCHRLYGVGGTIGPDLTGAGRKDLNYLLSNIIDPSAVVTKDFQMTVFALVDGRVVNGVVVSETDAVVTVQTDKERIAIPKSDIDSRKKSQLSLMPEGQLQQMKPDDIRNLIAYLMSSNQVPLPPGVSENGTGTGQ
ncbi:MAG: hypothetical protein LC104_00400 [Bacteroidales bacterium]|nr:hypothetical protein [Bacteroidales bacterium]